MSIKDATEQWVKELNEIPHEMVSALYYSNPDEWTEITTNAEKYAEDDPLPMSGMWMFSDPTDEMWAMEHIPEMSECGFRIYDTKYGYVFGIEGCGYDFMEKHWIPLYETRGLHWHD